MAASKILMVAPEKFYSNPQTAHDNFFQQQEKYLNGEDIDASAKKEFHDFVTKLTGAGIEVKIIRPGDTLQTPDAIFPNNWFSTHPGGELILYPMFAGNRRLERRPEIISSLKKSYRSLLDLTFHENASEFLEGTGSLVIDHAHRIAYASLSKRTNIEVLDEWSKKMNHEIITFTSYDGDGKIIYHTNVMMSLGNEFAIICSEAIRDDQEKSKVFSALKQTNHEIIEISIDQMLHFCGNCLLLENQTKQKFLVMSDNAFQHFSKDQITTIEKHCSIIHSNLETIEKAGGGGARCMLAELY